MSALGEDVDSTCMSDEACPERACSRRTVCACSVLAAAGSEEELAPELSGELVRRCVRRCGFRVSCCVSCGSGVGGLESGDIIGRRVGGRGRGERFSSEGIGAR